MKLFTKTLRKFTLAALLAGALLMPCQAQSSERFQTPEAAVESLEKALKSSGNTAFMRLFGEHSKDLADGADAAGMMESRRLLSLLIEERWALAPTENGNRVLRLGDEGWPFPIPIVASNSRWYFDTEAGLEEVANRRVGRNELIAIETCERLLDAEEDFRLRDADDDMIREYTSAFRSSEGQRDGLYWTAEEGESFSPLEKALEDSWKYAEGRTEGSPWFGYRFRFLTGQGRNAPGGAMDYVINGQQVGGFAVVAYPANYGKSGVMTFLVNQNGTVFQKDLGEQTKAEAESMKLFDPDDEWTALEGEM